MKKLHPFLMLLSLLLSLGILGAGLEATHFSKSLVSVCDVDEEEISECIEELPEETTGSPDIMLLAELNEPLMFCPVVVRQHAGHSDAARLFHHSLGWMLPLRI